MTKLVKIAAFTAALATFSNAKSICFENLDNFVQYGSSDTSRDYLCLVKFDIGLNGFQDSNCSDTLPTQSISLSATSGESVETCAGDKFSRCEFGKLDTSCFGDRVQVCWDTLGISTVCESSTAPNNIAVANAGIQHKFTQVSLPDSDKRGSVRCIVTDVPCTSTPDYIPAGWTCPPEYYDAEDGCDCNCGEGVVDPDCLLNDSYNQTLFNCAEGVTQCAASGQCAEIPASANLPPAEWKCHPDVYAAGDGMCDCDCGAPDPDCVTVHDVVMGCQDPLDACDAQGTCYSQEFTDSGEAMDMAKLPPTWDCAAKHYNSRDGCDCGCGAPDPDCDETDDVIIGCKTDQVCNSAAVCVQGISTQPPVVSPSAAGIYALLFSDVKFDEKRHQSESFKLYIAETVAKHFGIDQSLVTIDSVKRHSSGGIIVAFELKEDSSAPDQVTSADIREIVEDAKSDQRASQHGLGGAEQPSQGTVLEGGPLVAVIAGALFCALAVIGLAIRRHRQNIMMKEFINEADKNAADDNSPIPTLEAATKELNNV